MPMFNRFRKIFERRILAGLYGLGQSVLCPYCNWSGWRFLPAGAKHAPNRLCPECGSLERYRMFLLYIQQQKVLDKPIYVLDLAPRDCFKEYIQQFDRVTYFSSDLNSPSAMLWSDLTQMGMANNVFDLIICSHILEHIPDDSAAFSELGRMLKPGGMGLLMVPIRGTTTLEIKGTQPDDYERLYGQVDHVRWYGLDIAERMRLAGLEVDVLDMFQIFGDKICRRYALYGEDQYVFRFSK